MVESMKDNILQDNEKNSQLDCMEKHFWARLSLSKKMGEKIEGNEIVIWYFQFNNNQMSEFKRQKKKPEVVEE